MHLRNLLSLVLVAIGASFLLACSPAQALHHEMFHGSSSGFHDSDPISGEWSVVFKVNETTTPATFNLKLEGTKVTGTAYSEHTGPGEIRDGSWVDGKLNFTLEFKKHESIAVTGVLKDGKLVGEFRTEGFVAGWEATRKQP